MACGEKGWLIADRVLWKERHKTHLLEVRADEAETYAIAVFELAASAADEAALAVLQALLARNDADTASDAEVSVG